MITEAKPYLDGTKDISEWIVAVGGACGVIWYILRKAASIALRLTPKNKSKAKGKKALPVTAPKASFAMRIAVTLLLIFPYVMGLIYYSYDDFWTAALWFLGQGLVVILVSSAPRGRFDLIQLWFLGFLISVCFYFQIIFGDYMDLKFRLAESNMQLKAATEARDRSRSELELIRSIEYTLGVELKVPPKPQNTK